MITRMTYLSVLLCFLAGCAVTTQRFAPEYSREYVLASDTRVWKQCGLWTGWYSLNIGGDEIVQCLVSDDYGLLFDLPAEKRAADQERMLVYTKGSAVRIKRIFKIVHTGVSTAELLITDPASGATQTVFAQYWPRKNLLLPLNR